VLCDTITGVIDGTIGTDKAAAVAKLSSQVNQSFYLEAKIAIDAMRIGTDKSEPIMTIDKSVKTIAEK